MPIKNDVILVSHYGMTSRSNTSSQTAREAIDPLHDARWGRKTRRFTNLCISNDENQYSKKYKINQTIIHINAIIGSNNKIDHDLN